MKILILKLSSLGDIIHCLPVLNNLKKQFPKWQIDWLISENFAELLEGHSQINKIYKLPKKPFLWKETLKELKKENYDFVLEMQGLIKTSLIAKYICKNKIIGITPQRERIGELFLTNKIQCPNILNSNLHIIERNISILQYFGIDIPCLMPPLAFNLPEEKINNNKPSIICAPETRWESKTWTYWNEFILDLANSFREYEIILLGSQKDQNFINYNQITDLRGQTTLKDLKKIIFNCSLLIGSDSGLIHLASAYNKKTLGFYGPTSPLRTGPWQGEYIYLNLECSPCHKRHCFLSGENNLKCLKQINSQKALQKVKEILSPI